MKQMLSVLLGFLPWIVFAIVSGPSLFRLNAAIIAALVLVLTMGYKQLAGGYILTWGSAVFFAVILVMVVILVNPWFIGHLEILSQETLAFISLMSLLVGKPFVLQYARESVPPERQASPTFYSTCRDLTIIWSAVFILSTIMCLGKAYGLWDGGAIYRVVSFGLIASGLWLNHWYPKYVRGKTAPGNKPA